MGIGGVAVGAGRAIAGRLVKEMLGKCGTLARLLKDEITLAILLFWRSDRRGCSL